MCSIRNAPTGTMPLRECRRRSKKLVPCPARSGATPETAALPGAVETLVANGVLLASSTLADAKRMSEPLIIFLKSELSQGREAFRASFNL